MRLKTKIWSKGAHLSKSRFGDKERRKVGEEAKAWEKSSSRWDFFPLLSFKRSSNLQEKIGRDSRYEHKP